MATTQAVRKTGRSVTAQAAAIYIPDHRSEWEPSPRWVRAVLGNVAVANSKRVRLLRAAGRLPVYYFPEQDIRADLLTPSPHTTTDQIGTARFSHVTVKGRTAENAAWTYTKLAPGAPKLKGYFAFEWKKMDAWFEEDEEVFVHARDPYKRIDVCHSSRHIRVVVGGETVADTRRPCLLFETSLPTRYYIPKADVRMELLEPSDTHTRCPYKGVASYYSVKVGEQTFKDLVWYYRVPIPECPKIENLLCFFNEKVDIYIDGELQPRPVTPWA